MAFKYSNNQVETKILDASNYVANRYVEFKLDEEDVNYLADMRLINLGATAANSPTYAALGGASNLIKHIELLDGREVLCSSRHISPYMAFQQTRLPNEKNKSVNNFLLKSDYAYQAMEGAIKTGGDPSTLTADSTTTPKSHISLSDCLPLLERIPALSSAMFKNLRIRIEFETSPYKVISTADAITTIEPSLCVDIVRGQMSMPSQVSWLEVEHDQYVLSGSNPSVANQPLKTPHSIRLNGFNNKFVERMLLVKQFDDETKYGVNHTVKNGSLALFKEELQVRINGANKFPEILDKDCVRSHVCEDAWGVLNVVQQFNRCYTTDAQLAASQIGLTDYNGLVISEAVKDLQIQHNRSCINDSSTDSKPNSTIKVHVYCEVRKALNMKGGDYQIMYV